MKGVSENNITDEELMSLSQAINKRYGINFSVYEPTSLKRRITRFININDLNSTSGLWQKMLKDQNFIYQFIDEITVCMTSMFRDTVLWKSLRHLLQSRFKNKNTIRIWHAGCSSGEEVYSMCILLREMNLLHKARILATDINERMIKQAQEGRFHPMNMEEYERNYLSFNPLGAFDQYYTSTNMNRDLMRNVEFQKSNLLKRNILGTFDIIFCRNVMIYFDTDTKISLMNYFSSKLPEDGNGYFIIGFYDAMISLIDQQVFKYYDPMAKIFEKKLKED